MMLQTLPAGSGWRLLKIHGQLDFVSCPTLETAIAHAADEEGRHVLVDLEEVKTVDAKGIDAVVSAVRRLLAEHPAARVALVTSSGWLADEIAHGGIPAGVKVYRSGSEALAQLRGPARRLAASGPAPKRRKEAA